MLKRDADTRVRRIARRIVSDVDSEGALHGVPPDLEDMLYKVQSEAISLSVSTSELIGLMKRQDPEYAAAVDAMENPSDEGRDEETDEPADDDGAAGDPELGEAGPGEPDEGEDEKD